MGSQEHVIQMFSGSDDDDDSCPSVSQQTWWCSIIHRHQQQQQDLWFCNEQSVLCIVQYQKLRKNMTRKVYKLADEDWKLLRLWPSSQYQCCVSIVCQQYPRTAAIIFISVVVSKLSADATRYAYSLLRFHCLLRMLLEVKWLEVKSETF